MDYVASLFLLLSWFHVPAAMPPPPCISDRSGGGHPCPSRSGGLSLYPSSPPSSWCSSTLRPSVLQWGVFSAPLPSS